jgi:hypothetical protein
VQLAENQGFDAHAAPPINRRKRCAAVTSGSVL